MSKPSDRESKSHSNGEVFRAYVTDSQDSLAQPKGKFKDLFEKFIGKRNRSVDGKKLNGSKPLQSNSPVRLTSKQTE